MTPEPQAESQSVWTNEDPRLHLLSWEGEGLPLLMTHGMAGNAHWWAPVAPHLASAFQPAALDFHGHGDSDWLPDGNYDTDGLVDDIEAARHALGWPRMALAGHSLGARVAIEYARRKPERVAALVAVDFLPEFYESRRRTFRRTRTRSQPVYRDPEVMAERFHLQPPGTLLEAGALRELARKSLRKARDGWTWKFDWRAFLYRYEPIWPVLHELRVPVLAVRGEQSVVMERADLERVGREIKGCRTVEIPRAHHHVPLDAPRALAREMLSFAAALAPAR